MTFPTVQEIAEALQARHRDVAMRYAPGGRVHDNRYWAVCPWRADRHAGSFYVAQTGPYAGRFRDEATGEMGDMLDLIRLALNTDVKGALAEARAFLGMANETPAQKALRERQVAAAKAAHAEDERQAVERARAKRGRAHAIWLQAVEDWAGSPVDHYLAGRAITLTALGRRPNVIRFAPKLRYYQTDKDTGEVFEGDYPAMVTAVHGPAIEGRPPKFYGIHQTYLGLLADGRWVKADHPDLPDSYRVPKGMAKIFSGTMKGGFIRLWSGIGPRGGKGAPLARALGTVWIAEGIEDALSAAVLDPARRVLAGISLGNLQSMVLPRNIDRVMLIADNDADPKLAVPLDKAVQNFMSQGRMVEVWRNPFGGKDLNDALIMAMRAEEEERGEAG